MSGEVFEKTRKGDIEGGGNGIDSGGGTAALRISVIPKKPVTCFSSTKKV